MCLPWSDLAQNNHKIKEEFDDEEQEKPQLRGILGTTGEIRIWTGH